MKIEGHTHTAVSYQGVSSGFDTSLWTKHTTYSLAALEVNKNLGKGNRELPDWIKSAFEIVLCGNLEFSLVAAVKHYGR